MTPYEKSIDDQRRGRLNNPGTFTSIYSPDYRKGQLERPRDSKPLFAPYKPPAASEPSFRPRFNGTASSSSHARAAELSSSHSGYSPSHLDYSSANAVEVARLRLEMHGGFTLDSTSATSSDGWDELSWLQKFAFTIIFWCVIGGLVYGGYRWVTASSKPVDDKVNWSLQTQPYVPGHHKTVTRAHKTSNKPARSASASVAQQHSPTAADIINAKVPANPGDPMP